MGEFDDKVAVITGGSSGLGESVVKKFLNEGAKVAILDVDMIGANRIIKECKPLSSNLLAVKCDVSDEVYVVNAFKKVLDKFKRIDILHANAAIAYNYCSMIEMDKKDWDQIIKVNLTGVFLTCKYAIRQMIQQKYGKVVLTSSNWAAVSDPGYANYCAAKGGVLSFGKAIALEYGHYNINVNIILPGNMYTPQLLNSVSFEKTDYDFIVSKIGMVSKSEDVANLVLFLSSDKASALKGASIFIDQGETIQYGKGIVNIK